MRTLFHTFIAVMVAGSIAPAAQQEKSRQPRKGDEVIVKGCLKGTMLEATETALVDGEETTATPYTFQIKGKKDLVRELRKAHEGEFVELTGILQSELDMRRGTQLGRTGIYVGGGTGPADRTNFGNDRIMPVLDVRSYAGSGASCRR